MHLSILCICKLVRDMVKNNELAYNPNLEGRPRQNLTKNKDLQKRVSDENKITYNSYGVLVRKKRNELRSYISGIVSERVPIIYDQWRKVPLDIKEKLWTHSQEKYKLSLKPKPKCSNGWELH